MARIRSIKPEFPQSESMGRVSRDARLLFIMLWTIADDAGRLRGNSRMLASLLFPYDDDAKGLIDGWLTELSSEGCLSIYRVANDTYIEISNWLIHQKIDKPSKSKIPSFSESSRILANPREVSSEDQRKGSKDQGEDQGQDQSAPAEAVATALTNLLLFALCPPTKPAKQSHGSRLPADWSIPADWITAATEIGVPVGAVPVEASKFRDYWCAKTGKDATKLDWLATWRNWCRNAVERTYAGKRNKHDLTTMNYKAGVTADGRF